MSDSAPTGLAWLKTTSWLLLANVFRNLGLIAILILLARYTSAEDVGHYSLSLAITTPIFVLAEFGMRTVYLTLHKDYRFSSFLTVRIIMLSVAFVVSVGVAAFFPNDLALTIVLVAAVKSADSLSDLYSAPLQKYNSARTIFRGYVIGALVGSIAVAFVLQQTSDLNLALTALLCVSLGVALILMWPPARRRYLAHEPAELQATPRQFELTAIVAAGLPTGVAWALLSLVSTLPQYFLAPLHGAAAVGRFAILLYVLAAVELFMNALSQAWIPQARHYWREANTQIAFAKAVIFVSARWTVIFIPLSWIGVWLTYLLLPVVFGEAYTIGWAEAIPLALCITVTPSVFFGTIGLNVRNLYAQGIVLSSASAVASFTACIMLVTPFGVAGAIWATCIAYFVRSLLTLALLRFNYRMRSSTS